MRDDTGFGLLDLSDAHAPPIEPGHASIVIGGDVSGQVAAGNNIVQLRIGEMHGDVLMPAAPPVVTRRPPPVRLLPRRPAAFVDRVQETRIALDVLRTGGSLAISGEAGVGKSTLVRHLAHQAPAVGDGVAHLRAAGQSPADLLRLLFDVAYETDRAFRPTPGQLRHFLQPVDCTLILDDVGVAGDDLADLLDHCPASRFVVAARPPAHVDGVHPLPLEPVPAEFGIASGPVEWTAVAARGDQERRLLALLVAFGGLRLNATDLAALSKVPETSARLADLVRAGLVRAEADGREAVYEAATGVAAAALPPPEVAAARARVAAHLTAWAGSSDPADQAPATRSRRAAALLVLRGLAAAGRWEPVSAIAAALDPHLAISGRWDAWREVLDARWSAAGALGDDAGQALALHQLGTLALCLGERGRARSLLGQALARRTAQGDSAGARVTAHNLSLLGVAPGGPGSSHGEHPWRSPAARAGIGLAALGVLGALLLAVPGLPASAGEAIRQVTGDDRTTAPTTTPTTTGPRPTGSHRSTTPTRKGGPTTRSTHGKSPTTGITTGAPPGTLSLTGAPGPVEADQRGGAAVSLDDVMGTNDAGDDVLIDCNPPSGSVLPLGRTLVTCTSTGLLPATFEVEVVDTTPPTITATDPIIFLGSGHTSYYVDPPDLTATDVADGTLTPACTPALPGMFGYGKTSVTCTATDSAGNTGEAKFTVDVQSSGGIK